jgi:hypothetical protein
MNSFWAILAAGFAVASFLVLTWVGHSNFGQRAMGLGVGVALAAAFLASIALAFLSYSIHLATFGLLLRNQWLLGGIVALPLPAAAALLVSLTAFACSQIFGASLVALLFDSQSANQPQARRAAFFHGMCLFLALTPLVIDAAFWAYRLWRDVSESGLGVEGPIAAGAGLMYLFSMVVLGIWTHFLARLYRALASVGSPTHQQGTQARTGQQLSPSTQSQAPQTPIQNLQHSPQFVHASGHQLDEQEVVNLDDNDESDWRNFAPLTRRRDAR